MEVSRRTFVRLFSLAAAAAGALPTLEQVQAAAGVEDDELLLEAIGEAYALWVPVVDSFFTKSPILAYMEARRADAPTGYLFDWQEGEEA